ncbi:MAG: hypothetical protein ACRBB6_15205 [Neptuniibacter sp.]
MKSGKILFLSFLILMAPHSYSDEIDTHAAKNIVESIIQQCEQEGMLACEPRLRGIDLLFDYIREFRKVFALEAELKRFVTHKYPNAPKLSFDAIKASRYLAINVDLTTKDFSSRVMSAQQVKQGYDVVMDRKDGPILKLRRFNDQWVAIFPDESKQHFSQLKTLSAAGKLKRAILIYRMLEADLTDLTKFKLEENINQDLAPLVIGVFGDKRFPTLAQWHHSNVDEVINFYSQFSNTKEMRNHLEEQNKLAY